MKATVAFISWFSNRGIYDFSYLVRPRWDINSKDYLNSEA